MLKNHSFDLGDKVIFINDYYNSSIVLGETYQVVACDFFCVKVLCEDDKVTSWINSHAFMHVPKVTIVKKHLRRIVLQD